MDNVVCLLLLCIAHLFGDYYFQTEKMVSKKNSGSIVIHVIHALLYFFFVFWACFWFGEWWITLLISLAVGIMHFVIDYFKCSLMRKELISKWRIAIFFIDQIIHIAILIGLSFVFSKFNNFGKQMFVSNYQNLGWSISLEKLLLYIFSFLFLVQPASVINKFILAEFFKQKNDDAKAGALIGILERLTMYSFCALLSWYAILPVVLTAKTFARFERFKDKNDHIFAEKYIVGTLLSTIYVALCLILGLVIK